jgi:hypothetical protein
VQPDAANFNSWRRHIRLVGDPPDNIVHAWEDVKVKVKIRVLHKIKGQYHICKEFVKVGILLRSNIY